MWLHDYSCALKKNRFDSFAPLCILTYLTKNIIFLQNKEEGWRVAESSNVPYLLTGNYSANRTNRVLAVITHSAQQNDFTRRIILKESKLFLQTKKFSDCEKSAANVQSEFVSIFVRLLLSFKKRVRIISLDSHL